MSVEVPAEHHRDSDNTLNGKRIRELVGDRDEAGIMSTARRFARAKVDYKTNASRYGLSTSDARTAWLYAKSNKHSVCPDGDTSAKL